MSNTNNKKYTVLYRYDGINKWNTYEAKNVLEAEQKCIENNKTYNIEVLYVEEQNLSDTL